MTSPPLGPTCPVCAEPRAAGTRNPAWSCGDNACRQAAHKAKHRLIRRFTARHGKAPPRETIAAMAMRAAWKPGKWFSKAWAATAASRSGIHLDEEELDKLLHNLVEEVLDETVTANGDRLFAFPPPRRRPVLESRAARARRSVRGAPKRGVRAGASHGVTVTAPVVDHVSPSPHAPLAAPRHGREAAAALTPAPSVKMISPPTIDGGTAFEVTVEATGWRPELRELLARRDRDGWKSMRKTVTLHNDDGEVFIASVRRAEKANRVVLEFEDAVQLELFDTTGRAVLITKKEALWTFGLDEWMKRWFGLASGLLLGVSCGSAKEAAALGWQTKNVELCADFTGLRLGYDDVQAFVGGSRGDGPGVWKSKGYKQDGSVETVESAPRGRNALTVSTHNKTQKLREDKTPAEDSVYSSTWLANGWNGRSEIRRVEVRAAGHSLCLTNGKTTLDLRRPEALLDRRLLDLLWRHATERFRLVVPPKRGNELRHRPVDPRWVAVQRAGGEVRVPRLVVDQSDVRRLSLAVLRSGASQRLVGALARAAGLHVIEDITAAALVLVSEAMADPVFERRVLAARASRDVRARRSNKRYLAAAGERGPRRCAPP
jgi:hypothetical protein